MRPLTGDGTRLREVRTEDLEDYLAIVGDDRVTSWLSFDSYAREAAQTSLTSIVERSAHENRPDYLLAVTRRDDDRMIGFARLWDWEKRERKQQKKDEKKGGKLTQMVYGEEKKKDEKKGGK